MIRDVWAEINARPSSGRRWGGAVQRRTQAVPIITEKPIRPRFAGLSGKCPHCGSRFFGCCEKDLEDDNG
jgi:hypothetical protein